MRVASLLIIALIGFPLTDASSIARRTTESGCPAVWSQVSSDLGPDFLGSDGQCTDLARAAIRFAFHDSGE